jgi:hypothetical protein
MVVRRRARRPRVGAAGTSPMVATVAQCVPRLPGRARTASGGLLPSQYVTIAPLLPRIAGRAHSAGRRPGPLVDLLPDDRGPLCWLRRRRGRDGLVGVGRGGPVHRRRPRPVPPPPTTWWRDVAGRLDVHDEGRACPAPARSPSPASPSPPTPRLDPGRAPGAGRPPARWTGLGHRVRPPATRPSARSVTPVRRTGRLRYADGGLPVVGLPRARSPRRCAGCGPASWPSPRCARSAGRRPTPRSTPASCSPGWPTATPPAGRSAVDRLVGRPRRCWSAA